MNSISFKDMAARAALRRAQQCPEGYEYKGHKFSTWEERQSDCIKIFHEVTTPEGKTLPMPWSPYDMPTVEEFQVYVDLGCPRGRDSYTRPDGVTIAIGNFDTDSLLALVKERS